MEGTNEKKLKGETAEGSDEKTFAATNGSKQGQKVPNVQPIRRFATVEERIWSLVQSLPRSRFLIRLP